MTTDTPSAMPAPDFAAWDARQKAFDASAREQLAQNKTVLFDALQNAGITAVIVHFDGYGDSGQIEDIEVRKGDETSELPTAAIEVASPVWDSSEIDRQTSPIADAIETMAYDFLSKTHDGWENNDGAYGDFTFDVAARTITLDYNERYTSSENYTHDF